MSLQHFISKHVLKDKFKQDSARFNSRSARTLSRLNRAKNHWIISRGKLFTEFRRFVSGREDRISRTVTAWRYHWTFLTSDHLSLESSTMLARAFTSPQSLNYPVRSLIIKGSRPFHSVPQRPFSRPFSSPPRLLARLSAQLATNRNRHTFSHNRL